MIVSSFASTRLRVRCRLFAWHLVLGLALFCVSGQSRADTLSDSGIETVPYRLSITPSRYLTVRGVPNSSDRAATRASLSYLDRPLSVVIPTAERDGMQSQVVAGALVFEMAVARLWSNGLDTGLAFGAHLYQFGDGLRAVTGEQDALPHFGGLDPMLEVGYRRAFGRTGLRAFGAVYLPLGSPRALSAEKRARGEAGVLVNQHWAHVEWGAELSFLYRPLIDLGESAWGSQLKVALAGRFRILERFWAGPEFLFRPQLARQPGDHRAFVVPNLLLAALEYRIKRTQLTASYGVGVPLTRVSDEISKQHSVRAPTTPVQHGSLTVQVMLD